MTSALWSGRRRIGIYGGTFFPPHNGHVRAALSFLETARLDVLYVVPTAVPPHKTLSPDADSTLRLAMVRAAFENADPRICVSDFEILNEGISYTYRTLAHFSTECPGELFLLCGSDQFLTLDTWRCPEKIFSLATVACAMRSQEPALLAAAAAKEAEYRRRFGARIVWIPMEPVELSSSLIRQMICEGRDVSELVPAGVYRLIGMHKLYRRDAE